MSIINSKCMEANSNYMESIVWIVLIMCIFFSWLFYNKARHAERLLLIEKGINIDEQIKKEKPFTMPWLKFGIIVIGLSIGLTLIAIVMTVYGQSLLSTPFPIAILGLCGGASFIIAHYIGKKAKGANG